MMQLQGLTVAYGQSVILRDFSMTVEPNCCNVVMGRNGVGKTTLLRTIMGQCKAWQGTMTYNGVDLLKQPPEARARHHIGYVPQGRQIFPLLTVEENLRTGLGVLPRSQRVLEPYIYELFPVLRDMARRRGGDLSGGQQQQLAIARALAIRPRLLLLDEPTEGIQPNIVTEIGNIIKKLRDEHHLTIIVVEQKLAFARQIGDHYVVMERGANKSSGTFAALTSTIVDQYLTV